MSKKVAVVLAGCGVYDGAGINKAGLALLCLEQQGASYQCFAPDLQQMHVINHLTGEPVEGEHLDCPVSEARVDAERKLVTTPAYMLAGSMSEAYGGISECVKEVMALA